MRDTSERAAGTAKGNHQLRRRRTEEGGTRHGKPIVLPPEPDLCVTVCNGKNIFSKKDPAHIQIICEK